MPPVCVCGHKWEAHYVRELLTERECVDCEDLAYFGDRQPLDCCTGYLAETEQAA